MAMECEHLSATGLDQAWGMHKVWRCDACGWLYRTVIVEGGITRMVGLSNESRKRLLVPEEG